MHRFFKVIACEIFFREICHAASRSPSLLDLEFITQGLHDTPCTGGPEIQRRIDAVPEGKYEAILLGYGLCGNLIRGLTARHTPLVVPRAHDCISLFLGSKERYQERSANHTGAYYYTSGWLECLQRRGLAASSSGPGRRFLPARAGANDDKSALLADWTAKYGADQAHYLLETMDEWTQHYTHGTLIDFGFTRPLELDRQVRQICASRGWHFELLPGDLSLMQRWVDGRWAESEFLLVKPNEFIAPAHTEDILSAEPPPS